MKTVKQNGSRDTLSVNTITLIGVLLAGGQSTRMGTDKALLPWAGTTLLNHQFSTLNRTAEKFDGYAVVSGRRQGFPHMLDLAPNLGPLSGIQSAFALSHDGSIVLLLPIDMPYMTVELMENLVLNLGVAESIQYERFELPLAVRVTENTKLVLNQTLQSPNPADRSIRSFISKLDSKKLLLEERDLSQFTNLNFMQEYFEATGAPNEPAL